MDYGNGSMRQRRKAGKNAWVWELRINLGSDATTGKRRQTSRMFIGTKTAAADALRKLHTEMAEQRGEVHTIGTLFDDWIEKVLVPTRRPGTVTGARSAVSAVLKPALGHLAVETLESGDLDTFYTEQRQAGKKPGTIRRYHSQISAALQVATDWGWRPDNPARKAHPPAPESRKMQPPSANDVQRLIAAAAAKDPAIGISLLVLAITGLRRGEVLGLQWRDVNMTTGSIDVRRIVNRGTPGGSPVVAEPKTARSVRQVVIQEAGLAVLRTYRATCDDRAMNFLDRPLADTAFVVSQWPDGSRPVSPDVLTATMARLCKDLGLATSRLHDIRHFVATAMIAQGLNVRQVADALGHSRPSITLDVYSHEFASDLTERRRAASALESLVVADAAELA
ncbi:MAG TPA: site-specific integrase [Acidimicrobiales bacterium]